MMAACSSGGKLRRIQPTATYLSPPQAPGSSSSYLCRALDIPPSSATGSANPGERGLRGARPGISLRLPVVVVAASSPLEAQATAAAEAAGEAEKATQADFAFLLLSAMGANRLPGCSGGCAYPLEHARPCDTVLISLCFISGFCRCRSPFLVGDSLTTSLGRKLAIARFSLDGGDEEVCVYGSTFVIYESKTELHV